MKVLVACEFSGTVRDAFLAKGHDAMSCDVLDTDVPGPHYKGDVRDILGDGWDLMIAHPPCTYISNAGAKHLYPKGVLNQDRLALGMEAVAFFRTLLEADIPKICIENPIPSRVFGISDYTQIIQPYEHGHPFQKKTCLWLKGLPKLVHTDIVERGETTRQAGNWFNKGGKDRQKNRAVTFPGIAAAMAQQWGSEQTSPSVDIIPSYQEGSGYTLEQMAKGEHLLDYAADEETRQKIKAHFSSEKRTAGEDDVVSKLPSET